MELRDYLRGLRRHWIAILLMTAIGIGAGYAWTLLQTPVYTAGASGYVSSKQSEDIGTSTLGDTLARSRVQSYLDIAGWRSVAENAIEELGLDRHARRELVGGDADENARILRRVLEGGGSRAQRDFVAANAAAALVVAGVTPDLREGAGAAREILASGAGARALDRLIAVSQEEALRK